MLDIYKQLLFYYDTFAKTVPAKVTNLQEDSWEGL